MAEKAEGVAGFLKGTREPAPADDPLLPCGGEKNVTALIAATGIAQTSMSQHLARLKEEGIVAVRRDIAASITGSNTRRFWS